MNTVTIAPATMSSPRRKDVHLINLTPHAIVLQGSVIESDGVARVTTSSEAIEGFGGLLVTTTYGEVTGLPVYQPCGWCDACSASADCQNLPLVIVSAMVGAAIAALPSHKQPVNPIVSPSDMVRDADGKIIGCNTLTRWTKGGHQ